MRTHSEQLLWPCLCFIWTKQTAHENVQLNFEHAFSPFLGPINFKWLFWNDSSCDWNDKRETRQIKCSCKNKNFQLQDFGIHSGMWKIPFVHSQFPRNGDEIKCSSEFVGNNVKFEFPQRLAIGFTTHLTGILFISCCCIHITSHK